MTPSKFSQSAFLCAVLLAGAGSAAAYVGPCQVELNAVESAIMAAQFTGSKAASDQSNLIAKLQAAEAKVTLAKYSDAVDKLQDISDTATALAGATKPKLEDASLINGAVVSAIGCVSILP